MTNCGKITNAKSVTILLRSYSLLCLGSNANQITRTCDRIYVSVHIKRWLLVNTPLRKVAKIQVKAEGLAQLSYLVSSGQFAFVVDPQLDISTYIDAATSLNVKNRLHVGIHRNEDFISGAAAVAQRLDMPVYHGPNADENVEYASCGDGDKFNVGDLAYPY